MIEDPAAFFTNSQQDIEATTCDLFVVTAYYELRRMNLSSNVSQIVQKMFFSPVVEHVTESVELRIRDYDPAVLQNDGTLWRLPVSAVTNMQNVLEQLNLPSDEITADTVPSFGGEDEVSDIKGFAARVETSAGVVTIFQKLAQSTVLKSSTAYRLVHSERGFNTIDVDAVFQIAAHANCAFVLGESVYLMQPGQFEFIFDYQQRKTEFAEQKVHQISDRLGQAVELPDNVSLWSLIDGQKRLVNKLQRLDIDLMPTEHEVKLTNNQFELKLEETEDGKIKITTRSEARKLIGALNEDYLLSIRGNKFETHSKERIDDNV